MVVHEVVRSQLFYIDTSQRSGGTIGAPEFTFPNNLVQVKRQESEEIQLTLQEMTIEATWFQVEQYNNKVCVRSEITQQSPLPPVGTIDNCVEIPIGNYTIPTFLTALSAALNSIANQSWTLSFDPRTNFITYSVEDLNGQAIAFFFIFDSDAAPGCPFFEESLNESMGFARNSIVEFSPQLPDFTVTSTIPITMNPGVSNLLVTIDNQCTNYGNTDVANVFTPSNILAKVPVSSPPNSTIFFFDINNNFQSIINNTYLDNLNITLVNERFTRIEPRKNWTATIKIEIIRIRAELDMKQHLQEMLEIDRLRFLNDSQR